MSPESIREARKRQDFLAEFTAKGWYHSFELPGGEHIDGYINLEALRQRYSRFPIPGDLTGKRVLDVGAWDGWFTFEAERRGAQVTAVDGVDLASFREIHRKLNSRADYRVLDVFDLPRADLGRFDFVFFLGVLYHLKHPLLGLEIICKLTNETALVDSFVTDGDSWRDHADELPALEFYETDELAGRLDNWFGPGVTALLALCRAAGFARVELLHAHGHHAAVACHRRWEAPPADGLLDPPQLLSVVNHADYGINFTASRDQYLTCWFRADRDSLSRNDLRLEVGGFGAPALFLRREEDSRWVANFRLPPGLDRGWHSVRLRLVDTGFGGTAQVAVDVPLQGAELTIREVCDGRSWEHDLVRAAGGGRLSLWVAGLGENCDRSNVEVYLRETRLSVDFLGAPDASGYCQINVLVPELLGPGEGLLSVAFGSAKATHPVRIRIIS